MAKRIRVSFWNRNYTEKQIFEEIDKLKNSVKNDWSKFGDLSDWARRDVINSLNKIKRMLKSPRKIEFEKTFLSKYRTNTFGGKF